MVLKEKKHQQILSFFFERGNTGGGSASVKNTSFFLRAPQVVLRLTEGIYALRLKTKSFGNLSM